jgi:hypothetical protein
MERGTFKDPKFVKPINDACVPLVMPTSWKDFPSVDVKVGDKVEKRYKDYPRLTVEEARALMGSAETAVPYQGEFEKWVTPVYVVANAKKEHLVRTLDRKQVSTAKIFQDIQTAQSKLGGAGADQALWRSFQAKRDAAKNALDADEFAQGLAAVAEGMKLKGLLAGMKTELESCASKLAARGEEILESIAPDDSDARDRLTKLADQFKGHALEPKIRDKLGRLK